jgi:hypothetical protein
VSRQRGAAAAQKPPTTAREAMSRIPSANALTRFLLPRAEFSNTGPITGREGSKPLATSRHLDPSPPRAQHPGAGHSPQSPQDERNLPSASQQGAFSRLTHGMPPGLTAALTLIPAACNRSVEGSEKVPGMELAPCVASPRGPFLAGWKFTSRQQRQH